MSSGGLAQLVECALCKREAPGSKPGFSTPLWSYSVMVITLDFESSDPGSNPGRTFFWIFITWMINSVYSYLKTFFWKFFVKLFFMRHTFQELLHVDRHPFLKKLFFEKWKCVVSGSSLNFFYEFVEKLLFASYGHTTLDIPDPIRTPKSSRVGLT